MTFKTSYSSAATYIIAGLIVLVLVRGFAAQALSPSTPIILAQASGGTAGHATTGDAEAARIAEEEESFMKLLAEQRREEAEAKATAEAARKAAAKKGEAERVAKEEESFMKLLAEQRRKEAEAKAAAEAARKAAAEKAEAERVAREEEEFLKFLAEQRRQEAEAKKAAAEAEAAAEAARKAAAEKAEAERVAREEEEFLKFLAEQRRQEAEAKKAAAEAEAAAEAARKAAAEKAEAERVAKEEESFMRLLAEQRRQEAEAKKAAAEAKRKAAAKLCEERLAEVGRSGTIQFASSSASIAEASKALLDKLAGAALACERELSIQVDGHSDATGPDELNMRLSRERAQSVADYLAAKGIARERLTARGFGESQPIADNRTKAGRAKNRRIEFKVN